jgi:hypothetical protein
MKNKAILFALAPLMAVGTLFGTCPAAYAATNAVASAKAKVELPPYLKEDFNSACEKAKKEGRLVFVSLGREICGRSQKFYGFVRDGKVKIDPKKYVFIRLDVDNYEHREYFYSTFDPPDRKLPFVGVMDGDRTAVKEAISGSHTPEEYQKLMSDE